MAYKRCRISGDTFRDGRKHQCGLHTSLIANGGKYTESQNRGRIPVSSEYPFGGFCCNTCHAIQDEIDEEAPTASPPATSARSVPNVTPPRAGSVGVGILAAMIAGIGFHAYELPWFIGMAVGAVIGYWYKVVLKIAIVVVLVGLAIAVVASRSASVCADSAFS